MTTRISLLNIATILSILLAACGGSPAPAPAPASVSNCPLVPPPSALLPTPASASSISWTLQSVPASGSTHQVRRVSAIGGMTIPTRSYETSLDLLIMGSSLAADYGSASLNAFYTDVKPFLYVVFGSGNVLGASGYASPFSYYVTDFEYDQATPAGTTCNPGLPAAWVPSPNTPVSDLPAWDCNIALSTAGSVSLNLGMIVHRQNTQDRSKFNLFSSEYNSYAAILHELSHAAFVMSDEYPPPGVSGPPGGYFSPPTYPNVYLGDSSCGGICSGSSCVKVGISSYYRCQPADDATNLMYFSPQPTPGDNGLWNLFQHQCASRDRLDYIYGLCSSGGC